MELEVDEIKEKIDNLLDRNDDEESEDEDLEYITLKSERKIRHKEEESESNYKCRILPVKSKKILKETAKKAKDNERFDIDFGKVSNIHNKLNRFSYKLSENYEHYKVRTKNIDEIIKEEKRSVSNNRLPRDDLFKYKVSEFENDAIMIGGASSIIDDVGEEMDLNEDEKRFVKLAYKVVMSESNIGDLKSHATNETALIVWNLQSEKQPFKTPEKQQKVETQDKNNNDNTENKDEDEDEESIKKVEN